MEGLVHALVIAFYVAMSLALAFFVHKVAWFVRFRRLQGELVTAAERKVRDATSEALSAWAERASASWSEASEGGDDADPVAFVRRTEARLEAMDRALREQVVVREWFLERLRAIETGGSAGRLAVLAMPRVEGEPVEVALEMTFPALRPPRPPAEDLYTLEVRSRYGFWRRALVFVLGAADVVYSAHHVARMSQNAEVPIGVILRRLSLVVVILGAIAIDIALSLRVRLIDWTEALLGPPPHLATRLGAIGEAIDPHLATTLALGGWLAVYGAIYFGLYLFLRRRSQLHMRRLEELRAHRQADLDAIRAHHVEELFRWASEYAKTIDDAVDIARRQARLLIARSARRLRRRLASETLVERARVIAAELFERLPESSAGLEDVATRQEHTLLHMLWPRVEEMDYQVALARTRAAWRRLETGLAALRAERPDPAAAYGLWRTVAVIARMFPDVVDEPTRASLDDAYEAAVRALVARTRAELVELDRRLDELADGLEEQLALAAALLETQVELAEQGMEAEVAELAAELLEVREGARLEAMAFEI
ncbi:MAG: hypothetical protein KF729_02115 [Sandaracinaceae bacterium]|nr:hypothetical protein [Sandaracinaceae bacterium]